MWNAKCQSAGLAEFASHSLQSGIDASRIARRVTALRCVQANASATIAPMSCPHTA